MKTIMKEQMNAKKSHVKRIDNCPSPPKYFKGKLGRRGYGHYQDPKKHKNKNKGEKSESTDTDEDRRLKQLQSTDRWCDNSKLFKGVNTCRPDVEGYSHVHYNMTKKVVRNMCIDEFGNNFNNPEFLATTNAQPNALSNKERNSNKLQYDPLYDNDEGSEIDEAVKMNKNWKNRVMYGDTHKDSNNLILGILSLF